MVLAGAAGLCAQTSGRDVLNNGAVVDWRLEPQGAEDPKLGLVLPSFVQWSRTGFETAIEIDMHSDALAVVDAWEVVFYRQGDTGFERPVRRFRGTARTLDTPLHWDGAVEGSPRLRPGETLVARLGLRDIAGNTDYSEPQEILVARYMMRRERKNVAVVDARRKRGFRTGEAMVHTPLHGHILTLTLTEWPDGDAPAASGVEFRQEGRAWALRQNVTPGRQDIVIQSLRPILGGVRAIPVGVVSVEAPAATPYHAGVKGTGRLDKSAVEAGALTAGAFTPESAVPGEQAISRTLTNREARQERLAFALLPPDRPVILAKDDRMRRAFLSSYQPETAAWPGGASGRAQDRPPADVPARHERITYPVPTGAELFLPHTDIISGSIRVQISDGGAPLAAFRDYFVNADEGRVLLGETALSRLENGTASAVTVAYDVPDFQTALPAGASLQNGGSALDIPWRAPGSGNAAPAPSAAPGGGLFGKAMSWLFGSG